MANHSVSEHKVSASHIIGTPGKLRVVAKDDLHLSTG